MWCNVIFGLTASRASEAVVRMCFVKEGVLKNFTKFTRKHLCQSLFLNKVTGVRPPTLLKRRLWHKCFPVNFVKFLRTPFFKEHLRWLQETTDLVTLTEEILNGKLHFLCSHSILKYKTASVDNDTQIYWLFESISCCMRVVFNCSFKLMNYRR